MPADDQQLRTQLRTVLAGVVGGTGLVLEDVLVSTVGRRRLVRVVVDLAETETGSADLDRVADASRAVGDALDESDVLGEEPYALEVSTPGVDRPLTERRHWLRARTRLVRAERDGREPVTGRLVEVTDAGPVLLVTVAVGKPAWKAPPTTEERVELTWDEVVRGVVEVEFRRADDGPDDGTEESDDLTDESDEHEEA